MSHDYIFGTFGNRGIKRDYCSHDAYKVTKDDNSENEDYEDFDENCVPGTHPDYTTRKRKSFWYEGGTSKIFFSNESAFVYFLQTLDCLESKREKHTFYNSLDLCETQLNKKFPRLIDVLDKHENFKKKQRRKYLINHCLFYRKQ